jgi:hypothetical protein
MTARAARDDSRIPVVETGEPIGRRPAATRPALRPPARRRASGYPASGHGGSAAGHSGHCRTAHPAAGPCVDETVAHALRAVQVKIILPVHNEQDDPPCAVQTLHRCLVGQFPFRTLISIAGNGSTDRTCEIGASLAARLPGGSGWYGSASPAGGALPNVRTSSEAEILAYTDVNLPTNLNALLPLVAPAWPLPAASRLRPAHRPSTAGAGHTPRRPSDEY